MSRSDPMIKPRSAKELIEATRGTTPVYYDVELGLARHRRVIRSGPPLPDWADAPQLFVPSARVVSPIAVKGVLLSALFGSVAVIGAWLTHAAWGGSQPDSQAAVATHAAPTREVREVPETAPAPATDVPPSVAADAPTAREARSARASGARRGAVRRRAEASPNRTLAPEFAERDEPAGDAEPARELAPASPAASSRASQATAVQSAPGAARTPASTPREPAVEREAAEPETPAQAAPRPRAPTDLQEMQELATAEAAVKRDPARALALIERSNERFPDGYFQQERLYVGIMALIGLDRVAEARAAAVRFFAQYAGTPYAARIRRALDAAAKPAK